MPTTSNFGWSTPADTDLVKDGAAAIRTLGNGIDTSLVDLKGGTTGQNLRKASNTDLDFTFAGDATNTVVDAAGDLLYGTANDTLGRLPIGTAGQVLKVNSGATAPEWGAASGAATFIGASVFPTGDINLSNNTWTALTFDSETYDTDGFHSTSTNTGRFTIPSGKAGYYQFRFAGQVGEGQKQARLYKNGSAFGWIQASADSGANDAMYSAVWYGAVADYFEIYVKQSSGATRILYGTTDFQNFQISYLGA